MKLNTYVATQNVNLRELPSTSGGTVMAVLAKGAKVQVIEDFVATNEVGTATQYRCVSYNGWHLWCVATALKKHVNYLEVNAKEAKVVYEYIYKAGVKHGGSSKSFSDIRETRRANCESSASAGLQNAGCLAEGYILGHTAACKGKTVKVGKETIVVKTNADIIKAKNTLDKAIEGYEHLIEGTCNVVRVDKTFAELPKAWQKAGMVYIQDSNICVSAGIVDGKPRIWSCNKSGQTYGAGGAPVLRESGYPFDSVILYVVAPNS